MASLLDEIHALRQRVDALEKEVRQLKSKHTCEGDDHDWSDWEDVGQYTTNRARECKQCAAGETCGRAQLPHEWRDMPCFGRACWRCDRKY
jgi:hypothetical protein